jgi:hypothetical protein
VEDPYIGGGELVVGSAKAARVEQELEEVEHKRYELMEVEQALATLEAAYEARQKMAVAEFDTEKRELLRRLDELKRQAQQVESRRETMKDMRD